LPKQLFPPDLELTLPYRAPHEFRNNRTLILIAKGLVKCRLNVIWNTKINGGHGRPPPLLKLSTIKLDPSLEYGQAQFQWIFAQFCMTAQGSTPKHSASIGLYRYQAKYFDGQPGGKIQVVLREIKGFQEITSAGDY
jgi:hypothetical protein